jgi:hypothetical protein
MKKPFSIPGRFFIAFGKEKLFGVTEKQSLEEKEM